MKKILFMINTLGGGGAEKVIVDLLNRLDKNKYNITLLTVNAGVHAKQLSSGIHYRCLVKNKTSFLGNLTTKIIYHLPYRFFRFLFIRKQYDLEIAYLEGFPTRVIASGRKNTPKIAFVHCDVSVSHPLKKYYKNNDFCLAEYQSFDKVCFVSEQAKKGFEKTYACLDNAVIVHNVVNTKETIKKATEDTDFSFKTKGVKIVTVGRLVPEKGYDRLIRVAAILEKTYSFEICILGEGSQRQYLEDLIEELNVTSVKLMGYKENPYSCMVKADVFVCSSLFEGYSTAVTESIILGVPVVTTDCAGMDELLYNGEIGIVTPNTEEGLLRGLESVLADTQLLLHLKEKIKKMVIGDNIKEYEKLFKELF